MTIFKDFNTYTGGIYVHTTGEKIGEHSVKIIGWGSDTDVDTKITTKYWIGANSWGPNWGENGFFRIKMGQVDFGTENFSCQADYQGVS